MNDGAELDIKKEYQEKYNMKKKKSKSSSYIGEKKINKVKYKREKNKNWS